MASGTFDLTIPGGRKVTAVGPTRQRGGPASTPGVDDAQLGPFTDLVSAQGAPEEIQVLGTRGGSGDETATFEGIDRDAVVEVELDGGVIWWTTAGELADRAGRSENGRIVLPADLGLDPVATRGVGSFLLRRVRRWVVDLAVGAATDVGSREIARRLESRLERGPGLFRFPQPDTLGEQISSSEQLVSTGPWLLFLHGTFSTATGSFGRIQRARWDQVVAPYASRVLAFEHRSVSESPISNARDLVRLLPEGAALHLVSHSRGGMIGELLCRAGTEGGAAFRDDELALFDGRREERDTLEELTRLLDERRLRIERFVRVAAPVRGTILASDRLDLYLSVALNALGLVVPGPWTPAYQFLKALTLALVEEKADPRTLPGLEAMIPDSPLVKLFDTARGRTSADLTVVAGDSALGGGIRNSLKVLAADLFYRQDHDFVVDTRSMFWGFDRPQGQTRYLFDRSPDTSHFAYFGNPSTGAAILRALGERPEGQVPGFTDLATSRIVPAGIRGITGEGIVEPKAIDELRTDRPVVVLLPGIMGSRLRADDNVIWVDKDDLVRGGFERLALDDDDGVEPAGLVEGTYEALAHHLAGTHEVVPFSFDWRRDIDTEARRLAGVLDGIARHTEQPVRLLTHSMGGLVARRARALDRDTWTRISQRTGFRFIMLGTPNRGSHAISSILLGQELILRLLMWFAPDREVRRIVGGFAGLLAMLPPEAGTRATGDTRSLYQTRIWEKWNEADDDVIVPTQDALAAAQAFHQELERERELTESGIFYVAGHNPRGTPYAVDDRRGRPRLLLTPRGDGRVPWETGIPKALLESGRVWYAPGIDHGSLASDPRLFGVLAELLARGETASPALSRERPSVRGEVIEGAVAPEGRAPLPTRDELLAAALGRELPLPVTVETGARLTVGITNGSLTYARGPVAVGHYDRDIIASAEAVLDRTVLEGALSRRHALGLYPGPVGTSEVILDSLDPTRGGLIIGLGPVGELAPGTVSQGVRQVVLRYALQVADLDEWQQTHDDGRRLLRVTSLLIGSGAGSSMSIEDSLLAVVRGVADAMALLEKDGMGTTPRIEELEIVELYEHRAICASEALRRLDGTSRLGNGRVDVVTRATLRLGEGSQRDIPCGDQDWYRRIQIVRRPANDPACAEGFDDLAFTTLTDRARAEVRLHATQRQLVHRFVERAVGDPAWRPELARTLFDLLIPHELKDYAPSDLDLLLVLDLAAAGYPWELISDGLEDREPLAVRGGMLRQLAKTEFREHPLSAVRNDALVIGDPSTEGTAFAPLPGARQEATLVADRLAAAGIATHREIGGQPEEAVIALYHRPYRVLHIAAHGDHDPACPRASGVVLANGMRITAAEIHQLRQTPELVFVNCCHLGRFVGGVDTDSARAPVQYHQLAAGLGVELIDIGVRAVVVAGWAVDDGAAATFADVFYRSMLAGEGFGDAVKAARQACYRHHPTVNTWGAYQCYGDPSYQLAPRRHAAVRALADWTTPVRVVQTLDNLRSRARTGSSSKVLIEEVEAIERKIAQDHPSWLWNGQVREALGRAWTELADLTSWADPSLAGTDSTTPFQKALEHLSAALGCDDQPGTLDLRGDLTNIRVRSETVTWRARWRPLAERLAELPPTDPSRDALETQMASLLSDTTGRLNELFSLLEADTREPWTTPRRLTRLGSASKRLAAMLPGAGRSVMVRAALDAYRRANELSRQRCGRDDPYPAFNLALVTEIAHLADGRVDTEEVAPLLVRLEAANDGSTYWHRLLKVQVGLVEGLAQIYRRQQEGAGRDDLLRLAESLVRGLAGEAEVAARSIRSQYQLALYLESLDTLIDLTDQRWNPSQAGTVRLLAAHRLVRQLRAEIARMVASLRSG